jgi:hypothetical protein
MPSTVHQDQGRRLKEWQRATQSAITPQDAKRLIQLHLEESLPVTALCYRRISELHDGLICGLDMGFAIGAEISVRIERDGDPIPGFGSGHEHEVAIPYAVRVALNWGGTTRTVAEAAASIALYQLLVTAAAGIEAHFTRARITAIEPAAGARA